MNHRFVISLNFLLKLILLACLARHLPAQLSNQPLALRSQGQILVLRNGNVLRGIVERTPTHFHVHTPQNNRLVVPLQDAQFIAASLEEAYWKRLSTLRAADIEGQELLFFWCLKYELFESAKNQLEILQAIGMNDSQLIALEKRYERTVVEKNGRQQLSPQPIAQSSQSPSVPSSVLGSLKTEPFDHKNALKPLAQPADFFENLEPVITPLPAIEFSFDSSLLAQQQPATERSLGFPQVDHLKKLTTSKVDEEDQPMVSATEHPTGKFQIAQVGYEQTETTDQPAMNAFDTEPEDWGTIDREMAESATDSLDLSSAELTAFVKSLPTGSFQAFRQRIERHLVLNCGDCHRRSSTDVQAMPLMFTGKYQPLNARMSQRNIHAVLLNLDFKQPDESPILLAARTAHGGSPHPPLAEDSSEFQTLKVWIHLMAQEWKPPSEISARSERDHRTVNLTQPDSGRARGENFNLNSQNPSIPQHPRRDDDRSLPPVQLVKSNNLEINPPRPTHGLAPPPGEIPKLSGRDSGFRPKDEFDPAIFNRLNHRK